MNLNLLQEDPKELVANEPVRTSNYVRYVGLLRYELGMQYDAHECLLQLLAKIYPNINDDCMFKINKLESTLCNDCGHTTNNDGVCIDWSLHLEYSSNLQTIVGCYISLWIQGENI